MERERGVVVVVLFSERRRGNWRFRCRRQCEEEHCFCFVFAFVFVLVLVHLLFSWLLLAEKVYKLYKITEEGKMNSIGRAGGTMSSGGGGVLGSIRAMDFYRKIPKDLTEPTLAGGTMSVLSSIIMAVLLVWQVMRHDATASVRMSYMKTFTKNCAKNRMSTLFS